MMRDWDLCQQFMIPIIYKSIYILFNYCLIIENENENENETPNPGKKRWMREIEQRR